ncbi:MAG: hypothetical protein P9X24_14940 [Candidatus Hatepunaea meridiana]|nr:hypothetical protein [Candidatus Hatepunaea meridiana]
MEKQGCEEDGIYKKGKMIPAMEKVIAVKSAHRKRLAALPVPEKIRILVRMQKMATPILKVRGKDAWVWKIEGKE